MISEAEIKSQLKNILIDRPSVNIDILFVTVPGFSLLHEHLVQGETIKGYCYVNLTKTPIKCSAGKWLVVCTDKRLIFLQKSLLNNGHFFGLYLKAVDSIVPKTSWLFAGAIISSGETKVEIFHAGKADFKYFLPALQSVHSLAIE